MRTNIKKIAALCCCIVTFLLTSCTDNGTPEDLSRFNRNSLAGIWCSPRHIDVYNDYGEIVDTDWEGVSEYFEITDKTISYYKSYYNDGTGSFECPALYKDGYIYNQPEIEWEHGLKGEYDFDEKTQTIYFAGLAVGTFRRTGKDEAILTSEFVNEGKYHRIKGFKDAASIDPSEEPTVDPSGNPSFLSDEELEAAIIAHSTNGGFTGKTQSYDEDYDDIWMSANFKADKTFVIYWGEKNNNVTKNDADVFWSGKWKVLDGKLLITDDDDETEEWYDLWVISSDGKNIRYNGSLFIIVLK